jgi:arylformamidase
VAERRLYDISPVISPRLAVFPGDTRYSRDVLMSLEGGSHLDLSTVHMTVHMGAHVDAPSHYAQGAASIEARDPLRYLGRCQVVDVSGTRGRRVERTDLTTAITAPRVLFRTGSFPDPDVWNADFAAIAPDLIAHLHDDLDVMLVGIDTPSIDPSTSTTMDAHTAVAARDMAILEGIVLDGVPPGVYTLIALPLKLEGADASPVRAVLVDGPIG